MEPITGNSNPTGVFGSDTSSFGYGVFGNSATIGVVGNTTSDIGVAGVSSSSGLDQNGSGTGVEGLTGSGIGVEGFTDSGDGVYGNSGSGIGVEGYSYSGTGVEGYSSTGEAGYFTGNVTVFGNLNVSGTVTKGGGSFKIDSPLDPANKFLSHSFVESPDMKDIYDGNAVADAHGKVTLTMPAYFQALNQDFRYQLTAIGAPGPNLYIAKKMQGNTFQIAGGKPGMEVSWQVTGIRHDAWANAHRIPTEELKPVSERGLYLDPAAQGKPISMGIGYAEQQKMQAKN